jgi:hypothetical protein
VRVRMIPFVVALMAGAFASVAFAGAAAANTGNVAIGCTQVTFAYKHFPVTPNVITETITVDTFAPVSATFTFNGPTGTDTLANALAPGTHTVTATAQWMPHKVVKSFTSTVTITCGGTG